MNRFLLKATFVGSEAGNFTIKDNLGNILGTGVTKAQLLSGIYYDLDPLATSIDIVSDAPCGNTTSVSLSTPTTTTTTTTTEATTTTTEGTTTTTEGTTTTTEGTTTTTEGTTTTTEGTTTTTEGTTTTTEGTTTTTEGTTTTTEGTTTTTEGTTTTTEGTTTTTEGTTTTTEGTTTTTEGTTTTTAAPNPTFEYEVFGYAENRGDACDKTNTFVNMVPAGSTNLFATTNDPTLIDKFYVQSGNPTVYTNGSIPVGSFVSFTPAFGSVTMYSAEINGTTGAISSVVLC